MASRPPLVVASGKVEQLQRPADNLDLTGVYVNPHGWPLDSSGSRLVSLAYNAGTMQVTITANSGAAFDVWCRGVKSTQSSPLATTAHAATEGNWYLYWDGAAFTWSQTPWNLYTVAPAAFVYWSSLLSSGTAFNELHEWNSDPGLHRDVHFAVGTSLQAGGTLSGYVLNTASDASMQFAVAQTTINDEDLQSILAALAAGTYTVWNRSGNPGYWQWSTGLALPFIRAAGYAQINTLVGGSWGMVDIAGGGGGSYGTAYVLAMPALSGAHQFIIIPGQTQYASLAAAQAETFASLSLGTPPFVEFVPIAQLVFFAQHGSGGTANTALAAVAALTGSRASASSVQGVSTVFNPVPSPTPLGDASVTINPGTDGVSLYTMPAGTMTTNRVVTVGTGGSAALIAGVTTVYIQRRDLTANTLTIRNGGTNGTAIPDVVLPASPTYATVVGVTWDGVDWNPCTASFVV